MRLLTKLLLTAGFAFCANAARAQRPERPMPQSQPGGDKKPSAEAELVVKMMAFDQNKDGELTKDEITDERFLKLFERADKNKDGKVTKEELIALIAAEGAGDQGGGGRPGGDRPGGGGPGGPGGGRPGGGNIPGPGGPGMGGMMRPPQPGQIMPEGLATQLKLTDEQKKKFAELQKDLDAKMEKLLTDDQKKMLKEMKERGPMGPGGPGGRSPGGPGGEGGGR